MEKSQDEILLRHIQQHEAEIACLYKNFTDLEEDFVYRFYHQSFKVFGALDLIERARNLFERIAPEAWNLNYWYCQITSEALSKRFDSNTNSKWMEETRSVLEAYWHSKYFLEQMTIFTKVLEDAPQMLPSGWAAVLHLYNIRYSPTTHS